MSSESRVKRRSYPEAEGEVGIGDELLAPRHRIGATGGDGGFGAFHGELFAGNQDAGGTCFSYFEVGIQV